MSVGDSVNTPSGEGVIVNDLGDDMYEVDVNDELLVYFENQISKI